MSLWREYLNEVLGETLPRLDVGGGIFKKEEVLELWTYMNFYDKRLKNIEDRSNKECGSFGQPNKESICLIKYSILFIKTQLKIFKPMIDEYCKSLINKEEAKNVKILLIRNISNLLKRI